MLLLYGKGSIQMKVKTFRGINLHHSPKNTTPTQDELETTLLVELATLQTMLNIETNDLSLPKRFISL